MILANSTTHLHFRPVKRKNHAITVTPATSADGPRGQRVSRKTGATGTTWTNEPGRATVQSASRARVCHSPRSSMKGLQ